MQSLQSLHSLHCNDANDATHKELNALFGVGNAAALNHLGLMMKRRRAVDHTGNDTYLPNVERLALQWVFQTGVSGSHQATPLVIDGVMYLSTPQNHAYALDVRTGRPLWPGRG